MSSKDTTSATVFLRLKSGSFSDIAQVTVASLASVRRRREKNFPQRIAMKQNDDVKMVNAELMNDRR
jgi:hypothetical protein